MAGSRPKRVGDLEVGQDLDFQRHEWTAQRITWVVVALILVLALLGLFGQGVLSEAQAGSSPLQVEYERFGRFQAPMTLRIHIGPDAVQPATGQVSFGLERRYVEDMRIQQIQPEPDSTTAGADFITYEFQVTAPDQPTTITFRLTPERAGVLRAHLQFNEQPAGDITHFIYP